MPYTYHGTTNLITGPTKSVQPFPSGLVRIERSYFCRKEYTILYGRDLQIGTFLPGNDDSPAIDGAFIFPEPTIQEREDGFAEFKVSAYGRTNTTGRINRELQITTVQIPFLLVVPGTAAPGSGFLTATIATNASTLSVVVPTSTKVSDISIPNADTTFEILSTNYDALVSIFKTAGYSSGSFALTGLEQCIEVKGELTALSRTSYGAFDEISATVSGAVSVKNYATITITL
jgi:hypothetical protein